METEEAVSFSFAGNGGSNVPPEEIMILGLLKKGIKITVENVRQSNQHIDAGIVESIFDFAVGACGDFNTSELQFSYHIRASHAERCPQFSNVCTNQIVGSLIDPFHIKEFIQNFIKKVSKMDANMIK